MAKTYEHGSAGILKITIDAQDYPIACLTSTSLSNELSFEEKVNMCTGKNGSIEPDKITRTLQADGEVATDAGKKSYRDLLDIAKTGELKSFKLFRDGADKSFSGVITDISDSYGAEGTATFSLTIAIEGNLT